MGRLFGYLYKHVLAAINPLAFTRWECVLPAGSPFLGLPSDFTPPPPLVKLNSSSNVSMVRNCPQQAHSRENTGFPFDRPAGWRRFLGAKPRQAHVREGRRAICVFLVSMSQLLTQPWGGERAWVQAKEIVCNFVSPWRAERRFSAGQPRPRPGLLSHGRVGPKYGLLLPRYRSDRWWH